MFRVTEELGGLFEDSFLSSWIFDVEILARFIGANGGTAPPGTIHELPLNEWRHKGGSSIKFIDYLIALWELFLIQRKYLK